MLQIYGGKLHADGQAMLDNAVSMVAHDRLESVAEMIRDIVANDIPGDLIEAGVWRGGTSIFMREALNNLNSDKIVYVADSFSGVPPPDSDKYPLDKGDYHHALPFLSVPQEEVENNFRRRMMRARGL